MADRKEERELLKELDGDRYSALTFMHLRNLWAVDGLYYLGIEKRFGTEAATEIDAEVWAVMGKIEARRLKKLLGLGNTLEDMIRGLKYSGWTMDLEDKEWEYHPGRTVLRNVECRVQNTRLKDGLSVFPCKKVRFGFLKAFAREFNEDLEVNCIRCPPDDRMGRIWCEWTFSMKEG
ncbi:MAG: hypothetical protein JXA22_00465 [Candidatus Thermoplasmatota archaeon]|nr:hypothetical protein [Candidatus Thermoplasmatota archaeon]